MNKREINVTEYANTITDLLRKGVFLTTKAGDKVNSMVIGWGHIGRIWERPVFVAYVRDCRFTYDLLEENPEFTVNVPIHGIEKTAFAVCGAKSGRDMDKIAESNLTLVPSEKVSVPGIKEFPLTLECKVLYKQEQDASKLPADIHAQFYEMETADHTAYFGEIVAAYIIED